MITASKTEQETPRYCDIDSVGRYWHGCGGRETRSWFFQMGRGWPLMICRTMRLFPLSSIHPYCYDCSCYDLGMVVLRSLVRFRYRGLGLAASLCATAEAI